MAWEIVTWSLRIVWRHLALLLMANVAWLLLSLLVVTWPAATAGLFYVVEMLVREELENDPHSTRLADFWVGFRACGLRCTLLAVIDLAMIGLIGLALSFYARSSVEPARWLVGPIGLIGLAWAGMQLYLFPLMMRRPSHGVLRWLREALFTALSSPFNTVSLLLVLLVAALAAVALAGPVFLIFFSVVAVLQTVALRFALIQRHELAPLPPSLLQSTRRPNRRFPK